MRVSWHFHQPATFFTKFVWHRLCRAYICSNSTRGWSRRRRSRWRNHLSNLSGYWQNSRDLSCRARNRHLPCWLRHAFSSTTTSHFLLLLYYFWFESIIPFDILILWCIIYLVRGEKMRLLHNRSLYPLSRSGLRLRAWSVFGSCSTGPRSSSWARAGEFSCIKKAVVSGVFSRSWSEFWAGSWSILQLNRLELRRYHNVQ